MINPDFWHNKRVLITGHTGFKGAWLGHWLCHMGAKVTGFALTPPSEVNLFDLSGLESKITHIIGDLRDLSALEGAVQQSDPEIVLHLAAQALVRPSYADPLETFSTNIMGTANLLQVCRDRAALKAIVVVTTDKCYENKEWPWGYREIDPMGGHDPYSASKGCAELITASMRRSFYVDSKTKIASARVGNVIGGGDWAADRLVPDLVRAFSNHQEVVIRYPNATRPWQHVLDPLCGYLCLAQHLCTDRGDQLSEGWNFGPSPESETSVRHIVEKAVQIWGDGASWRLDQAVNPHEAGYLTLDCAKARHGLGWGPTLPLDQALSWTFEWYRDILKNAVSAEAKTLAQIDQFMTLLK